MNLSFIKQIAEESGCSVQENVRMAEHTTFRIGGTADLFVDPPTLDSASVVLQACRDNNVPTLWLGNGSNLLVGDGGFRGVVFHRSSRNSAPETQENGTVFCPSGVPLQRLCLYARDRGLSGLEFAYGIPGTVGGAVYMNAGAYGGDIQSVLDSVCCLTPAGETVTYTRDQLDMSYRHTALMESGDIVWSAVFRLTPDEKATIEARMKDFLSRRQEKQPLEYPSAGSFFRRPTGYFAGALIEQAGLKGARVGQAQISEKHAGFLINRGGATAADVMALCRLVQNAVWQKDGVRLEPEVRFVGEFTEE